MSTATKTFEHAVLPTPAGSLTLVSSGEELVAAGFCGIEHLHGRLGHDSRELPDLGVLGKAVAAYLDGDLGAIDEIPVGQPGTALQQQVWAELRRIPAGRTMSYGDLALRLGLPLGASRAIGSACGANLVAPVVPCHRVLRTDGSLGGYAYGLSVKRWLLAHEQDPEQPDPDRLW
jgi:methylated-DNA-[protein]-cysteine S-methyltransferase